MKLNEDLHNELVEFQQKFSRQFSPREEVRKTPDGNGIIQRKRAQKADNFRATRKTKGAVRTLDIFTKDVSNCDINPRHQQVSTYFNII